MITWLTGIGLQFLPSAIVFLQFSGIPLKIHTGNLLFEPRWHTETGNIWTHLIGGLIFIGLTLYYLLLPNMRFTGIFNNSN